MTKLKIKKDDMVLVIAGNSKDKKDQNGKYPAPHKVLKVLVKEQRAIVEGKNLVSKSTKPSAKNPQGGIVKQEVPIHISPQWSNIRHRHSSEGDGRIDVISLLGIVCA